MSKLFIFSGNYQEFRDWVVEEKQTVCMSDFLVLEGETSNKAGLQHNISMLEFERRSYIKYWQVQGQIKPEK